MRILFAGTPNTAVTVLGGLMNSGHEVVAVLTREDATFGRNRSIKQSPVAEFATSKGIPVIKANRIDEVIEKQIREVQADFGVVVAYGAILKLSTLNLLPEGWFNLHYSLLPKYRGAAPVQHAILNGDEVTGVTVFKLDSGMDTGPILGSIQTVVQPDENSGDLILRLSHLGIGLLNEILPKIYSGLATFTLQLGTPSFAPKVNREDARLRPQMDAKQAELRVRAMNPEPIAWILFDDEPMRILHARAIDSSSNSLGELQHQENPVIVCAGNSGLELLEVQPAGKKPMEANAWYRGLRSLGMFS
ncbi:MAG: methionyl-tRNA formyltransferase [Rhodoluna sp.]